MAAAAPNFRELWQQQKALKAGEGPSGDDAIMNRILLSKRRRLEAQASKVDLPTAPSLTEAQKRQQATERGLLQNGFFDSDNEDAVPAPKAFNGLAFTQKGSKGPDGTSVPTSAQGPREALALQPTASTAEDSDDDEHHTASAAQTPAGLRRKAAPAPKRSKKAVALSAIPEGFFDDQRKDAHVRDVTSQLNLKLKEEMDVFEQEISEAVEEAYEADQKDAQLWNQSREMDECQEMAKAHSWLESVRVTLEMYQKRKKNESVSSTACEQPEGSDSDSDLEAALDVDNWRKRNSRDRISALVRVRAAQAAASAAAFAAEEAEYEEPQALLEAVSAEHTHGASTHDNTTPKSPSATENDDVPVLADVPGMKASMLPEDLLSAD